jgi:hypothetical protein
MEVFFQALASSIELILKYNSSIQQGNEPVKSNIDHDTKTDPMWW